MRRVVITGLGTVNPLGNNVEDFWKGIQEGKCGIDRITHYDIEGRKVTLAAEVKDIHFEELIDKKELRKMDRFCCMAVVAADEAIKDAGITFADDDYRSGVLVSSGIGGFETIEKDHSKGLEKGFDMTSPFFIPSVISNIAAGRIAINHNIHGMCSCVVTACASSTNAVGDAFRQIRDGYMDVMVAGGAESCITTLGIGGFTTMKALNTTDNPKRASIPFDAERKGFVMGEGAGVLILEELEHALKRGAKIYGELVGYASTCDAHHITAPCEDGSGAANCMRIAMEDAGIAPEAIDYINAHGTSTPMNDRCETLAVKSAFGEHAYKLKMSSTKSMTGHLLGASGAIEAIIITLSVKNDYIPATINYEKADPDCDLNIVPNTGLHETVNYAMSNSLGFGGHNASIIVKKYQ